jgi:hypothetical protein
MKQKTANNDIIELSWYAFGIIRQGMGIKPRELQAFLDEKGIDLKAKTIAGYESKRYGRIVEHKYIQILRDMVGDQLFFHHYEQYMASPESYRKKYIPQYYC